MTETTTRTDTHQLDAITAPGLFERNSQRIRTALTDDQAKSILDEPLTRLHAYADETPDGQEATPPARDCATIIAALDVSRPFRDAVICLSIAPLTLHQAASIAFPDTTSMSTTRLVTQVLTSAFHDPHAGRRVHQAARMATLLTTWWMSVEEKIKTQLDATLAFLTWWLGEAGLARRVADEALSIDPDCVLAQLIRQAADNHVTPGWTKPGQTR